MNNKITNFCTKIMLFGTPIFYFLMSTAFYLRTYDSCQIKITICQIGGTILITALLIKMIEEWKYPFPDGSLHLMIPVGLVLASTIFSCYMSPLRNWFCTLDEFSRRIFYIALFLVIISAFREEKYQKRLLYWYLAGAFVAVAYGIVQFLDRFSPPGAVGIDPFIWRGAFGQRIFSTFGNPNFFGDFLLLTAPVILSFAMIKYSKFLIVFYIMTVTCIIFTYSKAAWVGYSAGVIAFSFFAVAFLAHGKKETIRKVMVGMSMGVFAVMVLGVLALTVQRVDSVRFRDTTWLSTWEMLNRTPQPDSYLHVRSPLVWKSTLRKLIHPLIGTGIGSFKAVYPAYRRPEIIQLEARSNTESDHPENEFLEVLYDEGIIGFGFFILLVITFILAAVKRLRTVPPQSKFVIHGLIGFSSGIISQLTHNTMCVSMRFVSSGVIFWFGLGMIGVLSLPQVQTVKPKIDNGSKKKPKFMLPVQIAVVLGCLYFVNYFYGFFKADELHNIAIFHSKRQEWDEAIRNYKEVIKYNPDYVMTHYFLGNVYNDRWGPGDPERVIEKYNDVLKIAPNYVQIFMQMGTVYSKMGKWDEAVDCFKKYQKLDPVFMPTYPALAMAYVRLGRWKDAENTFKRYIARCNWYYYYYHLVTTNKQNYDDGVAININRPEPWLGLGNIYYSENKYYCSAAMYMKVLKDIDPHNAEALRNLQIVIQKVGKTAKMQNMINHLVKGGPSVKPQ